MSKRTADAVFWTAFRSSTNFVTPDTIYRELTSMYAIELSAGDGFSGRMYGVTVLNLDATRELYRDKSFDSLRKAENYIVELRNY